MKKTITAIIIGAAVTASSFFLAADAEAKRCRTEKYFVRNHKVVETRCRDRHTGVRTVKKVKTNLRTGRKVMVKKRIDRWGYETVTRRVIRPSWTAQAWGPHWRRHAWRHGW